MKLMTILLLLFCLNALALDGYTVKTIETPKDVLFHITGLDIAQDGTVYVATRFGDVWALKDNKWQRFAQGLHEPTGLRIEKDGSLLITQKPEMTRLIDSNKDGVADTYRHVAHLGVYHNNYCEFNYGALRDKEGNLWGTMNLSHKLRGAHGVSIMTSAGGYRGWAYKITPDGKFIPWAKGLRSPAGVGMNNKDEVFFTDNQGDFIPTSTLNILKKDAFYGHPISLVDDGYTIKNIREKIKDMKEFTKMRTLPVAWIPHGEVANSPGNPEWNYTKGKFGPFENQVFIGDQTTSRLFRISMEKVGGEYQGCVYHFLDNFQCGNMRTRFAPNGELWIGQTGRGWASKGDAMYGVQKVVWDGKTIPFTILEVNLTKTGFKATFTKELDEATLSKISCRNWRYDYHHHYGSGKKENKAVAFTTVNLSADKKTIEFTMPLTKERVYGFDFTHLRNKDGKKPQNHMAYYTLNNTLE